VKIEYTFGILKSWLPILRSLLVRIQTCKNHRRTIRYITACIIIHNFARNDIDDWNKTVEARVKKEVNNRIEAEQPEVDEGNEDRNIREVMRDQMRMRIWEDENII